MMLPFRKECFDIVASLGVLYHRAVTDDVAAIKEMARVCRPGGYVIVTGPAFPFLSGSHDVAMHTARRHTAREIARKMAMAGLVPVKLSYWNSLLFPLVLVWRMFSRMQGWRAVARADMRKLPTFLNVLFISVLTIEARFLLHLPLPIGVSFLCVATKPMANNEQRDDPSIRVSASQSKVQPVEGIIGE